jgi:FkbM family methyltransferase
MSKILEVYKDCFENNGRFLDETFVEEIYSPAIDKKLIVDIGAYEGEFGYYCYNFAGEIYAIEPDPRPFNVMQKRVKKFELDKFRLFNIGISGKSGDRRFHASGYGGSTIQIVQGTDMMTIKTLSLDDFIKENGIKHIDILKIDVESSEGEIFENTKSFGIIDKIIGENHGGNKVEQILTDNGFRYIGLDKGVFIATK